MIISRQEDVTEAVLEAVSRTADPRLREIMGALVRHLHGFVREVKMSEQEFQQACEYVKRLGQHSTATHNEAVLMAGSLGVSPLVCLLNNGNQGQTETAQNMLGPFWRLNSPRTQNGASIVRSPTPGPPLIVEATLRDQKGAPVAGAEVDIWHSSPEGFYDNQDPTQADMNLRGKFTTDAQGRFSFRSVKPAGYPIPTDGPVGEMVRSQGRHNFRPAHLHFLIFKPGFKTLISQIYVNDDPYLETDVQFGVTKALIGNFVRHDKPDGRVPEMSPPWYSLAYDFVMEPGEARLPRAPIE